MLSCFYSYPFLIISQYTRKRYPEIVHTFEILFKMKCTRDSDMPRTLAMSRIVYRVSVITFNDSPDLALYISVTGLPEFAATLTADCLLKYLIRPTNFPLFSIICITERHSFVCIGSNFLNLIPYSQKEWLFWNEYKIWTISSWRPVCIIFKCIELSYSPIHKNGQSVFALCCCTISMTYWIALVLLF